MAIPKLLPSVLLIETAGEPGRIRLAGTGLDVLYQPFLKGRYLSSIFSPSDRQSINSAIRDLPLRSGAVLLSGTVPINEDTATFELILLALTDRDNAPSLALGHLTFAQQSAPAYPRAGQARVSTIRYPRPDETLSLAPAIPSAPHANIIEFGRRGRAPENARKVGHLAVIDGGASPQ